MISILFSVFRAWRMWGKQTSRRRPRRRKPYRRRVYRRR